MDTPKQPPKEIVRIYLKRRFGSNEPPPSKDEIDRQLGRKLAEQAAKGKR
jgi:hypothetical protein